MRQPTISYTLSGIKKDSPDPCESRERLLGVERNYIAHPESIILDRAFGSQYGNDRNVDQNYLSMIPAVIRVIPDP